MRTAVTFQFVVRPATHIIIHTYTRTRTHARTHTITQSRNHSYHTALMNIVNPSATTDALPSAVQLSVMEQISNQLKELQVLVAEQQRMLKQSLPRQSLTSLQTRCNCQIELVRAHALC